MTKVIILGQEPEKKKGKPIEFVKHLSSDLFFHTSTLEPHNYKVIEVVCLKYTKEFDLFFVYDDDRDCGILYLGHYNDGIVE